MKRRASAVLLVAAALVFALRALQPEPAPPVAPPALEPTARHAAPSPHRFRRPVVAPSPLAEDPPSATIRLQAVFDACVTPYAALAGGPVTVVIRATWDDRGLAELDLDRPVEHPDDPGLPPTVVACLDETMWAERWPATSRETVQAVVMTVLP